MNFSRSGASWTVGPRGASVGIGRRGTYLNTGIPGTGLYSRQRIGGSSPRDADSSTSSSNVSFKIGIRDDGMVYFHDANGAPLSDRLVNLAKKQQGEAIRGLIEKACNEINSQIEAIGELHFHTPDPNTKPEYVAQAYQEPAPIKPMPKRPGVLTRLFKRFSGGGDGVR